MSDSVLENFLNSIATDVSVAEFTRAVAEHPEWMPGRAPHPAAAPAPAEQLDAILEVSGLTADEQASARREARDPDLGTRIAAHDAQVAARLVDFTYSTQQAAVVLELDPSNIRRGVQDGRYLAVRVAGRLRLPAWQFIDATTTHRAGSHDAAAGASTVPLPNLRALVSAIPGDVHPQAIAGFMQTPQPELDDMTPIEWVTGGGDARPVSDLLTGLSRE